MLISSMEDSSQQTTVPDHPKEPEEDSNSEFPSPLEDDVYLVTTMAELTTPAETDWVESLLSDMFE